MFVLHKPFVTFKTVNHVFLTMIVQSVTKVISLITVTVELNVTTTTVPNVLDLIYVALATLVLL